MWTYKWFSSLVKEVSVLFQEYDWPEQHTGQNKLCMSLTCSTSSFAHSPAPYCSGGVLPLILLDLHTVSLYFISCPTSPTQEAENPVHNTITGQWFKQASGYCNLNQILRHSVNRMYPVKDSTNFSHQPHDIFHTHCFIQRRPCLSKCN